MVKNQQMKLWSFKNCQKSCLKDDDDDDDIWEETKEHLKATQEWERQTKEDENEKDTRKLIK